MLGIVSACYIGAATVAVLVMVIPPRLQYRYDNGYYSCIGHYNGDNAENNQKFVFKCIIYVMLLYNTNLKDFLYILG